MMTSPTKCQKVYLEMDFRSQNPLEGQNDPPILPQTHGAHFDRAGRINYNISLNKDDLQKLRKYCISLHFLISTWGAG